ncbi:hypothetical protein [Pseudanabaena sp. FACHB-2040]|uniref:hypothetical protein n=1 Tax=Pseudanabaena sp. FACHB-2040 TaxID=2692859 RepID=UPI001F54DC49|nr:hypothetical protein [Pseudanabaena sp. FACHB-2040]
MLNTKAPALEQDQAWFIAVPKRQEFSEPSFHFGERVKWSQRDEAGQRLYCSGRIVGMSFQDDEHWHYTICLDTSPKTDSELTIQRDDGLKLVKDSTCIRDHLAPATHWQMTEAAATLLGISAEQLRHLRRSGLFKAGHHYRDTSIPGSGKPRWQWHVERCAQALAVPPEKREIRG